MDRIWATSSRFVPDIGEVEPLCRRKSISSTLEGRNVDGNDMVPCPTLPSEFKLRRLSLGLRTLGCRPGSFFPRQRYPERLPESLNFSSKAAKSLVLEG
jgi:hypothetical protein